MTDHPMTCDEDAMTQRHFLLIPAICIAGFLAAPALAETSAEADPGATFFATMDGDGDGAITAAELAAAKTDIFTRADANGDGLLDADERKAAVDAEIERRRAAHQGRAMERLDTDGDGQLSLAEFTASAPLFDRADADGDGAVSRTEFDAARPHRRP
jgi:hypothetical protein